MRIRHLTLSAGPNGVIQPGDIVDVPDLQARDLIRLRYAEAVDDPERRGVGVKNHSSEGPHGDTDRPFSSSSATGSAENASANPHAPPQREGPPEGLKQDPAKTDDADTPDAGADASTEPPADQTPAKDAAPDADTSKDKSKGGKGRKKG